jgi:hypothetical protein
VSVNGSETDVDFVSCDKPHDGKVIAVADNEDACPAEATGVVERISVSRRGYESKTDGGRVLCIS